MMSETRNMTPILPSYADEQRPLHRLAHEIWYHLWPWSKHGFRRQRFVLALSVGLAAVMTVVWLLAAVGRIGSTIAIGWWVGWSVFEVLVRLQSKPYIKDGPWWGSNFRKANTMDMICYVSFKNLLIAVLLFLGVRVLDVSMFLHGLPALKWLFA